MTVPNALPFIDQQLQQLQAEHSQLMLQLGPALQQVAHMAGRIASLQELRDLLDPPAAEEPRPAELDPAAVQAAAEGLLANAKQ